MRIGFGYDVHRLTKNRRLVLGGVEIPNDFGLLGHSDADVLLHAVADALLGACALGDIGKLFPDTDDSYKDISSLKLLKIVGEEMNKNKFFVNNIDVTLALQKPKIVPFVDEMRKNIASALNTDISKISVKATTTEGLGFEGTGDGASAYAVCTVSEKLNSEE